MVEGDQNKLYNISFYEEGESDGPSIKDQVRKEFEISEQKMKLEQAMEITKGSEEEELETI